METKNHKKLSHIGRPTSGKVSVNPNKSSETEPQAWEISGVWFYNHPGAFEEARALGVEIPTESEMVGYVNANVDSMEYEFKGYRPAYCDHVHNRGECAYWWVASSDGSARFAFLVRGSMCSVGETNNRGVGLRVPILSYDTNKYCLFSEAIGKLESMKKEKAIEITKLDEAIGLLRNL